MHSSFCNSVNPSNQQILKNILIEDPGYGDMDGFYLNHPVHAGNDCYRAHTPRTKVSKIPQ